MTLDELATLEIGDEIFWNDPDEGYSSGIYIINEIHTESGRIEDYDSVIVCTDGDVINSVQIYASEIE